MSTRNRFRACWAISSAIGLSTMAGGCDQLKDPLTPETAPNAAVSPDFARLGQPHVTLCHRTGGVDGYIVITVAEPAVAAHLRHGDGLVGDPVPGQPDTAFGDDCQPAASRRITSVSGSWNGATAFTGVFTVQSTGPVDVTATVTGGDPTWALWLALLGFNPQAPTPPGTCGTEYLPMPIPPGPSMSPPTITAHWDGVPAGTYCLNVASAVPVPPYPPPYTWTATITHP